jgi:hypothetical protein
MKNIVTFVIVASLLLGSIVCFVGCGKLVDNLSKYKHAEVNQSSFIVDAVTEHNVEAVKYLIEKKGFNINTKDGSGNGDTLLACAVDKATFGITSRNSEIVNYLISKGADVNLKNNSGNTPLHIALGAECVLGGSSVKPEIVDSLITNGADVNAKNWDGRTPLHVAVGRLCQINVLDSLITNGADVNVQDRSGNTPLHEAYYWADSIAFGDTKIGNADSANEIKKYLLAKGASISIRNQDESTPDTYWRDRKREWDRTEQKWAQREREKEAQRPMTPYELEIRTRLLKSQLGIVEPPPVPVRIVP